jgi:hypothetical protein
MRAAVIHNALGTQSIGTPTEEVCLTATGEGYLTPTGGGALNPNSGEVY